MKVNGFFGKPGTGFILGKLGSPKSRTRYISSRVFPHALIVAPTGRGKTTGKTRLKTTRLTTTWIRTKGTAPVTTNFDSGYGSFLNIKYFRRQLRYPLHKFLNLRPLILPLSKRPRATVA